MLETRTSGGGVDRLHRPAMQVDEPLGDREPQARAAAVARSRALRAVEAVEDSVEVGLRYGGGRYINGLGPDFVILPPDSTGNYGIGLVKATSAILGLEYVVAPVDTVSAYWSTAGFGQRFDKLSTGAYVGYGYPGSSNSQNKTIDEYTLANTYTFWKTPSYGALQLIAQVSYTDRKPWYVAPGALSKANATMVFLDLRYVLP